MYLTARFAAVSKRNVHWVALKHRLNTWTLTRLYYVDIGRYFCVFITLLTAVQNSNIWDLSLKVNALSCPTPNPTLNLPDSVNKCKTDIKHICWCNGAISTSLYADLNYFVEPWLHRIWVPRLLNTFPYSVSYRTNLPSMKTHRYDAGYLWR